MSWVVNVMKTPDYYSWHPITTQRGIPSAEVVAPFPYFLGAAIKYIWRAGRKNPDATEDLEKAINCLQLEVARIKASPPTGR